MTIANKLLKLKKKSIVNHYSYFSIQRERKETFDKENEKVFALDFTARQK